MLVVTQNELNNMTNYDKEKYLLEVLQRKLKDLRAHAEAAIPTEQHGNGADYQRGMAAGFVSGLGLATRLLASEKDICGKVLQHLEEYNTWAQEYNRKGHFKQTEK